VSEGSVAKTISGKSVAEAIQETARERAQSFQAKTGRAPGLVAMLVGDDPASKVYVSKKEETAQTVGLVGRVVRLPATASQEEVLAAVQELNDDDTVDGILVQLPLPKQVDGDTVLSAIDPDKDVDGFHPINVGKLSIGLPACRPCTPAGVMEALRMHDVNLNGAHAVVVGRSNIVGKPQAQLLLAQNATVTICHSRTRDLPAVCRQADVLVAAVGRPGMLGADCIKPGATVIDVGINRIESPKHDQLALELFGEGSKRLERYRERGHALVGDVNTRAARQVAGLVTPVPGGVGPLTIAMLMSNTVDAAYRREGLSAEGE
jgi:methylenetetrahydrofolate dehydrogenase (NADP+)/methenyltetrahydrofolate cyclohydrolase